MAKIKFERVTSPTGSFECTYNPSRDGIERRTEYMQPTGVALDGSMYIYTKGIKKRFRTLTWERMPGADVANLLSFAKVVKGAFYSFIFTDYDGSEYTARIENADDLRYRLRSFDINEVTVKLKVL